MANIVVKFNMKLNDMLERHIRLVYKGFTMVKKYYVEEGMFVLISDFNTDEYIDKIIGIVPTKTDSIYSNNEELKIKEFTDDYNHFTYKEFYTLSERARIICIKYDLPSWSDQYFPCSDDDYFDDENNPDLLFLCLLWAIKRNRVESIKKILARAEAKDLMLKKNIKGKTPYTFALEQLSYESALTLQKYSNRFTIFPSTS